MSELLRCLVCEIAGVQYGIAYEVVQEIVRTMKVLETDDSLPAVRGQIDWRGNPIDVIDMRAMFGDLIVAFGFERLGDTDETAIVVVKEEHGQPVGLVVDRSRGVLHLSSGEIQGKELELPAPDCVQGVYSDAGAPVHLLDILKVIQKARGYRIFDVNGQWVAMPAVCIQEVFDGMAGLGALLAHSSPFVIGKAWRESKWILVVSLRQLLNLAGDDFKEVPKKFAIVQIGSETVCAIVFDEDVMTADLAGAVCGVRSTDTPDCVAQVLAYKEHSVWILDVTKILPTK